MALFQLVPEYNNLKGVCYLCKASKRITDRPETLVTTDMDINMETAQEGWNGPPDWLEFCETCVTEMARLLGMVTETEVQDLTFTLSRKDEDIVNLQKQVTELQADLELAVKALRFVPFVAETAPTVPTTTRRK